MTVAIPYNKLVDPEKPVQRYEHDLLSGTDIVGHIVFEVEIVGINELKKEASVKSEVGSEKIDTSNMTLAERARLFWGKTKQISPFYSTANPVSLQKGKDLIYDQNQRPGIVEITSLYSAPHIFYE
jgi:hypothetical protein